MLRRPPWLSIYDKDFVDTENNVINDFIKEYNIKAEIVSATETWAKTYLENEKKYYDVIDKLLTE